MNICVVGAGAIGGWVAARLALAGEQVMALTSGGALDRIELSEGGETEIAELARFHGPADLLLMAVKAPALAQAAQSAAAYCRAGHGHRAAAERRPLVVCRGDAAEIH